MACEHLNFHANVAVGRITDVEDGPVLYYTAGVTVKCEECGTPFHFVGLPTGLSPNEPMISWDGLTLNAPISPGPLDLEKRAHRLHYDMSKPTNRG